MDKFDIVLALLDDLQYKVKLVLSTLSGWFMMIMTFMLVTFGEKALLFHWIIIVLLLDLFFGSWSALKRGTFHISTALWSTASKIAIYGTIFFMPLILEKIISKDTSFGTISITSLLISGEFFSILAHMIIIKPDLFGVKMAYKLLSGEISKKLGINVEELESYFKNQEKKDE